MGTDQATRQATEQVQTFCPMCVSRCGATATITDGAFVALAPDPSHPTGQALCIKGKAASREHGPESVAFSNASPSTTAMSDSVEWITRLRRAFGSPNHCMYMELCAWGRFVAPLFTFGAPVPGAYMPDLDNAGCILFWGYNPSVARLAHATASVAAVGRGARLVVVDPRRVGLASRADHWLRVRPGTDAALALALIHVMIERGCFDAPFVRRWTNAPLLVRSDTGRLLRGDELSPPQDPGHYVALEAGSSRPVAYDPALGAYELDEDRLELTGTHEVATSTGPQACRPVLDLLAAQCRRMGPAAAEAITGVSAADIVSAARTLWEARPVAFYRWSGLEQHSNATQTARAIDVLYALTGSLDVPGGNVLFPSVPTNPVDGAGLLSSAQRAKSLGLTERPLGGGRLEYATGEDLYAAVLDGQPYRVRGLVNFGANLVMAHGDSARGRAALAALDFFVHADHFLSPTADLADIVLPVANPFEVEGLKVGFEISERAQSLVQLRRPVAPPRGEARSDVQIVFALATRLGLGQHFWDGDVDSGWRHQLAPSGLTLEQLRAEPAGVSLPQTTRYQKFAELEGDRPLGFRTASRKIELFSQELGDHGHAPLPEYVAPATVPAASSDLARRFPLVLTCAKPLWFCETQHRNVPSLRKSMPDPPVELHPDAAAARGIAAGDWVRISTPHGSVRARAKLNSSLDPQVVCAQHGWWQSCPELGLPGYPPFGPESANLNLVLRQQPSDPIGGNSPLRSSVCEIAPLADG